MTIATAFIAEKVVSYLIGKGLDHFLKCNDSVLFKKRLKTIIILTIQDYQKKDESKSSDGYVFFYESKIFLSKLFEVRLFSHDDKERLDAKELQRELGQSEEKVILPLQETIQNFLDIFETNLKKDEELRKLAIAANYKEEIYRISDIIYTAFCLLEKINSKLDRNLELTESIANKLNGQQNRESSFKSYIDSLNDISDKKNKSVNHFYYRSGAVPYVEREEEEKLIDSFRNEDEKVQWWCVTGSGGSGKSRFAYEYLLKHQYDSDWVMKFVPWNDDLLTKYSSYDYPGNLLVVIDYVAAYAKQIGQWLVKLDVKREYKIRVLLLERQGFKTSPTGELKPPYWYTCMNDIPNSSRLTCIWYNRKGKTLELKPLSDNQIINLVGRYIQSKTGTKISFDIIQSEILEMLKSVDPDFQRPLISLYLADAWTEKRESMRHWNREDLYNWINDNEIKSLGLTFGEDIAAISAAKLFVSFATAVGGVNLYDVSQLSGRLKEAYGSIRSFSNSTRKEGNITDVFDMIGGGTERIDYNTVLLRPMVPDIMGEYFCLKYFSDLNDNFDQDVISDFVQAAWNYPEGYVAFFVRLLQDYKDYDSILEKFIDAPNTDDEKQNIAYAKSLYALSYFQSNEVKTQRAVGKLRKLTVKFSNYAGIQEAYAMGLVNLSVVQEDESSRKATVDELGRVSGRFPDHAGIQKQYVKGLFNLSVVQEDESRIKATVDELGRVSGRFPDHAGIQEAYAQGLFNLSVIQEDESSRKATVDELGRVSGRFPDHAGIQEAYAQGLFNLSVVQEDESSRKATVDELGRVSGRFPGSCRYPEGLCHGSCQFECCPGR